MFVHMLDGWSARLSNDTVVDINCSMADGCLPILVGRNACVASDAIDDDASVAA